MPATLPEMFGRYRILKKLGEGGMATVYLAHDSEMDRNVALKVPQFDKREQQAVIEQFKREARIASRLRHPGICPIYDVGCVDGIHYLTMAFIEGKDLAAVLAEGKPWLPTKAIDLTIRIAEAMRELHHAGIVHRDLKPGNVLLQSNGQPVLLDFGLARSVTSQTQQIATRSAGKGTPAYMAPEQWDAQVEQIHAWTDVYALGVILFALLTGRRPFNPASFVELCGQVMHAERPRPSAFVSGIPPALDQLCIDLLAIDPHHRPADMVQLIERLKQARGNTPAREPPPRPRMRPWLLVPAVVAVVALSTWLLYASKSRTSTSEIQRPPEPADAKLEPTLTNSIGMKFTLIPAGTMQMGSSPGDRERVEKHFQSLGLKGPLYKEHLDREQPQHEVEITQSFYMGVYEVTQEEYETVMKTNPSWFQKGKGGAKLVERLNTKRFPVESVSWDMAVVFTQMLSNRPEEKQHRRVYRLPTEAEWEYACRGKSSAQPFHYGNKLTHHEANFDTNYPFNSGEKANGVGRPVAVDHPKYRPNDFGLYHMHGNVWEWCSDYFAADYYMHSPRRDPQGPTTPNPLRVTRSGSWGYGAWYCRSALRGKCGQDEAHAGSGFRIVCVTAR